MSSLYNLIKRNIIIFYRDKTNILFSTLSILIIIVLHFIVFQDMFTNIWSKVFTSLGLSVSSESTVWLVDSLMFSSIIPIGALTISLVCLSLLVADRENNVLSDFMVAPLNRNYLFASYLISSLMVGLFLLGLFLLAFSIYFFIEYQILFSLETLALIGGVTLLALLFANSFMLLIMSYVKSQQSLSTLGAIIGTAVGFISGAYIPVGQFGEQAANVLSILPFLQLTAIFRLAFLNDITAVTGVATTDLPAEMLREFGINVYIGDNLLTSPQLVAAVLGFTFIIICGTVLRFKFIRK